MATASRSRSKTKTSRSSESRWLVTAVGMIVLVAVGFILGLVAGIVSEEPELVAGHLVGRSERIDWLEEVRAQGDGAGAALPVLAASQAVVLGDRGASSDTSARAPDAPASAVASLPQVSAAPPTAASGFSVQVGAFAKSTIAEDMADGLRAKGYSVQIVPTSGRDPRWRVRVGPVGTRAEATRLASRLQKREQLPTWVLGEGES